jgi:3-oxocholest-4-en-26-oyl-CoA dehydrogenase beta subunit
MDFTLNERQRELAALCRLIVADKATPQRQREVEEAGDRFDPVLWADLAGAGILAAALPESLDGAGLGLLEQCSVLEELGRAVAPVPFLASIVLGAGAIAAFGTPDQQKRWAAPAGRGELIITAALSEEDSDDPRSPAATAEWVADNSPGPAATPERAARTSPGPRATPERAARNSPGPPATPERAARNSPGPRATPERAAGHWLLTGTKTAVPAGTRAGLILVPAATASGPAVFLVTPDDPGDVLVQPQRLVDGDVAGRLELTRVELPGDRVLGSPQSGPEIIGWLAANATVGQCALQLGVLARALELTSEYAKSRVQFGRPIGAFQAVAQRLADAYIDVEAVRLTMWQAAWRLAAGLPSETEIATAKFWAADAGHRVAHTAVHIHGGVGIDTDHPLHRYFVTANRTEFELGGATTQLRRIGAALARAD